jgi:hypothetical protein
MARKSRNPNFDQTLDLLRGQSFEIAPQPGPHGTVLVSKYGAGAMLAPVKDAPAAFLTHPGALIKGEVARLVDRGYQKFLKTSNYELPATAAQLEAIHKFSEELKRWIGDISLYNESLGTTSDLYLYDRLKGREEAQPAAARTWDSGAAH